MNSRIDALFEAFEKADPIVVFHHVSPDPDAFGSQLGFVEYLKARYPQKTILAAGSQEGMDQISDEQIRNGLALLCDTSTTDRVDDDRFRNAARIARVDHHLQIEDLGELDFVDEEAAAACEVAANLLAAHGETISPESAQHFLEGLISDSQRFTLPNVRPSAFKAAAWLLEQGADLPLAVRNLYTTAMERYEYGTLVRSKAHQRSRLMFSVMSRDDYLECGCPFEEAKAAVNELGGIAGIEIWLLVTQNLDGVHYQASVRSRTVPVVELANAYGGGGHACACGIKNLSAEDVQRLIEDLARLSEKEAA